MKTITSLFLVLLLTPLSYSQYITKEYNPDYIIQQIPLDGNNIKSNLINTGIFDINILIFNDPAFEWPKGTNQDAIFTAGLTTAALYNGNIRMASAMYAGEYCPGYIIDSAGIPTPKTDQRFKFYKISRGDNMNNNLDWANWGLMVPFGAPFIDVNHDNIYEPLIDTPGVRNASQTIFICLTDGFPDTHHPSEGFGGGTLPLYIESHLTAWCYDAPDLMDVQFIQWNVINKSHTSWNSTYFSLTTDPDIGCGNDDYIGCDSTRNLGFAWNGQDSDCSAPHSYTAPVPSSGLMFLNCAGASNMKLTSFDFFTGPSTPGPVCERDPNPGIIQAYNYMKGIKSDETPWMVPPGGDIAHVTKFCYSGDPESGQGWCESGSTISGAVWNCGGPGHYSGDVHAPNIFGDRRMVLSSGADNLTLNPGDTHKVLIAQLIARGTDRKNSVTKLKILADTVKANCSRGFIIGVEQISASVPNQYTLLQNYPNPFNPKTIINYQLPISSEVNLTVYNTLGEKIAVLVNEKQNAGTYKVDWDGTNYSSGIYFYQIQAGDFIKTNKMILLK